MVRNTVCGCSDVVVLRDWCRAWRAAALLLWAGSAAAPALAGFWVCPGNLLTNQLEPQAAQAQRCKPLEPGGLSQAQGPLQDSAEAPATLPPSMAAEPARPVAALPTATAAPPAVQPAPASPPARAEPPPIAQVRPAAQQRRDDDARQILQAELARTQAQIQALGLRASDPQNTAAAHRLRSDEAALQRELARLGR